MGAPQVIWVLLVSMAITIAIRKHGEPSPVKHNAWLTIIGSGIGAGLLYWGGFFG